MSIAEPKAPTNTDDPMYGLRAYTWPCPYCKYAAWGPSVYKTSRHVRTAHPERLSEWNRRTRALVVELVNYRIEKAAASVDWTSVRDRLA